MENIETTHSVTKPLPWRDLVWPKEHGSWSLALEPVALGLLLAPSITGGALACAAAAAFFARRPLKTALSDGRAERRTGARRALGLLAFFAVSFAGAALFASGAPGVVPWLLPSVVGGILFLVFDLKQSGREHYAEVCGAIAFAWLPAVFTRLGGWPIPAALAAGAVMLARAVPTVLTVRASIRARKTGAMHPAAALVTSVVAAAGIAVLARCGLVPWTVFAFTMVLLLRSFALLVFPRPQLRASTVGIAEAVAGGVYVLGTAVAWHLLA